MTANHIIILLFAIIFGLAFYIYDLTKKKASFSDFFYTGNKINHLEALSEKAFDKNPNIRLKVLKELTNLYENLFNYQENTFDLKKLILKELADFNFEIGSIYKDNKNQVHDILGKPFDSYNSKIIISENYFIKAIELYSKIDDCDYLKKTKNNFCNSFRELENIAKNDINFEKDFEKIKNLEINKCFNGC